MRRRLMVMDDKMIEICSKSKWREGKGSFLYIFALRNRTLDMLTWAWSCGGLKPEYYGTVCQVQEWCIPCRCVWDSLGWSSLQTGGIGTVDQYRADPKVPNRRKVDPRSRVCWRVATQLEGEALNRSVATSQSWSDTGIQKSGRIADSQSYCWLELFFNYSVF